MELLHALSLLVIVGMQPKLRDEIRLINDHGPGLRLEALDRIREEYGLTVLALTRPAVHGDQFDVVHVDPQSEYVLRGILPVLVQELRVYPPHFFRAIGLRRIVLCTDIRHGNPLDLQRAAGLACAWEDLVYVSVGWASEGREYILRHNLHHEIFHIADARTRVSPDLDLEWTTLNEPRFNYLRREPPGRNLSNLTGAGPAPAGFTSRYAMTNLSEDKAETFTHLMCYPWTVRSRSEDDAVLRFKAACLKDRLAREPYKLDERFWIENESRWRGGFDFSSSTSAERNSVARASWSAANDVSMAEANPIGLLWILAAVVFMFVVVVKFERTVPAGGGGAGPPRGKSGYGQL
jgi:hypothetical protein